MLHTVCTNNMKSRDSRVINRKSKENLMRDSSKLHCKENQLRPDLSKQEINIAFKRWKAKYERGLRSKHLPSRSLLSFVGWVHLHYEAATHNHHFFSVDFKLFSLSVKTKIFHLIMNIFSCLLIDYKLCWAKQRFSSCCISTVHVQRFHFLPSSCNSSTFLTATNETSLTVLLFLSKT